MTGRVKIRFSKAGQLFFKNRKYEVKVNDSIIGHIASNNPELEITLPIGDHNCEIRENDYSEKKDFNLKTNQLQTLKIIPVVQGKNSNRGLIGVAIVCIVFMYFTIDDLTMFIPMAMLPVISVIVMHFVIKRLPDGKPFEIELEQ